MRGDLKLGQISHRVREVVMEKIHRRDRRIVELHEALSHQPGLDFIDDHTRLGVDAHPRSKDHVRTGDAGLVDLHTQDIDPIHETIGRTCDGSQFLSGITDGSCRRLIPSSAHRIAHRSKQLPIQIISRPVIQNLVDHQRRPHGIAAEGEGLAEKVRDGAARSESRLNPWCRQRGIFKSDQARTRTPACIRETKIPPTGSRITRRLSELPHIPIADHGHRHSRANFWVPRKRFDFGKFRVARRSPCRLAGAPVVVIVDGKVFVAQDQRVARAVGAGWPASPIAVSH